MRRSAALKKLKPRRRRFVEEYVSGAGMNATEAARRAGYASRNPQNAHQIAWDLMQDPTIREAIDEHLETLSMSAAEAVKRLGDMARGDRATSRRVDADGGEVLTYDTVQAVIQVGKVHGIFVDRVEHSGEISGVLRVPQAPSMAEWTEQAKAQQAQIGNGNGGNRVNGDSHR